MSGWMQVGPTDLGHLLLIDYNGQLRQRLVRDPDRPVQSGRWRQTTSLVVTDTFGVRTLLRPHGDATLAPAPWSLFQLAQVDVDFQGDETALPENDEVGQRRHRVLNDSMMSVEGGAWGRRRIREEPISMQSVVRVSSATAEPGTQYPVWMLGRPRWRRVSLKHTARAAIGIAFHLRRRELDVPHRNDAQGNEVAVRAAAPILDHPVVVGHALEAEVQVLAFHERLAAEAGEGREGE